MIKPAKGFTLVELMIVIVLTTIFSSLILFFAFNLWRYSYGLESDSETLITRLNAGDVLREAIGTSTGLIIQNGLSDSHVLVVDPGNANYWLPIHAIPGTTLVGSPSTYTPLIYYKRFSFNNSGSYIINGTQPFQDEYVLYLSGTAKSLMLRSIANPSATGNRLKTSCPPALATSSCPSDKTVASDLASISMRYFSRTGNLIDYTSIWDPVANSYAGPDFTAVDVVEFTLNISAKPTFQKTNSTINSTIIRIALRNT